MFGLTDERLQEVANEAAVAAFKDQDELRNKYMDKTFKAMDLNGQEHDVNDLQCEHNKPPFACEYCSREPMPLEDKILADFDRRFKNPENTGYRVGEEFMGAMRDFIQSALARQKEGIISDIHFCNTPTGETSFCEACEEQARTNLTPARPHTCGQYSNETVEHFLTVIGCHATYNDDGNGFTKESWDNAVKYANEFIEERLEIQKEEILKDSGQIEMTYQEYKEFLKKIKIKENK